MKDKPLYIGIVVAGALLLWIFLSMTKGEGVDADWELQGPDTYTEALFKARTHTGKYGGFTVMADGTSDSMGQAVTPYAVYVMEPRYDETQKADLIVSDVFHQVVDLDETMIRTKGANNRVTDDPVPRKAYKGTITAMFLFRKGTKPNE